MNSLDRKYTSLVSSRLTLFEIKDTSPYRANFRCPVCGDSDQDEYKARGWFLEGRDTPELFYYCHNCFVSWPFGKFLSFMDSGLYNDYVIDKAMEKKDNNLFLKEDKPDETKKFKTKKPEFRKNPLKDLEKISDLERSHPARKYFVERMIPKKHMDRVYWVPKFKKWVNSVKPKSLDEKYEESRMVFPFIDENGRMFGFTGRSIEKNPYMRYISIKLDEDCDKIYGLEKLDSTKDYYVFEGPIDSLFAPNSIALAGADGDNEIVNNGILVLDHNPRNKNIVRSLENAINRGQRVVIWPNYISGGDLNKMVLDNEIEIDQVENFLKENTYKGLLARNEFSKWRQC